jgi:integrase
MRKGKAIGPDKLRLFCREHGGVKATAKVIGYTDQSIHNAINGQRMTQKMLDRLCNSFALAPDYFDIKEPVKEVALPIGLHPEQVSNRFRRAVRSSGLPHFRFHDLRHYYVSIAHALGVPDAYIMQMGGWKTDNVMHRVYRDTLPDVMQAEQDKLTKHFHDALHDA